MLDELIDNYFVDDIAQFYAPDVFEHKDYTIGPGERLDQPRSPEDLLIVNKAKAHCSRKYFSLPYDDISQEIELKLWLEESKQGFRFTGPKLMTIAKNAITDMYRKDARWYEKIALLHTRFIDPSITYEDIAFDYYMQVDEDVNERYSFACTSRSATSITKRTAKKYSKYGNAKVTI